MRRKRIPQAPLKELPELAEYLGQFKVKFHQKKNNKTLERYLTGLLTEHPNKNCDTMAEVVPGTNQQQLNNLTTGMDWDCLDLNSQRVKVMVGLETEGDGVLIFDDTGFAKRGEHSVGVARQYSGTLGKVANCQVAVNCHYAERTLCWPVSTRLYLPQPWAESKERRKSAHIPDEVKFETKQKIALRLLDYAKECGVNYHCIVADADYGDNLGFQEGLDERKELYCLAVRADFRVAASRWSKIERSDEMLSRVKLREWETIIWGEGSKGELRAKFVAIRCYKIDNKGNRQVGWLIGQRPAREQSGDWKYHWSNFPRNTPLKVMVEYAHRRHWVEQFHEEAKGELGWDQYQGRLWTGFHRHSVTVMLAYSFLVWLECRMRQKHQLRGRPRGLFSPS